MAVLIRNIGTPLKTRFLSAVILAPLFLSFIYFGGLFFVFLVAILMGIMVAEWRQLCNKGNIDIIGIFSIFVTILIISFSTLDLTTAFIMMVIWALILWVWLRKVVLEDGNASGWMITGVILLGCTGMSLVWLRGHEEFGLQIVLWLTITIWITDIFAYLFGSYLRGPKLAPTISPNKTWSGLIAGVLCASLWSSLSGPFIGTSNFWGFVIIGGGTAVLAQIGDLSISVVKRRFGVKDAGRLIPGHGGLLDRMDGFVGAVPFIALSLAVAKGDFSLWW
tara:strand:+ start:575 stop:1408 length:834 start_codon:yes stop_codon:yes gene_type:complete